MPRNLRTRRVQGGRPPQREGVSKDELRLPREEQLPEGRAAERARAVGAGGVDGPDLVVDAEQDQVHAREVAFVLAAMAAAVVAPDQDAALQLIAPDRVRRGQSPACGELDWMVMVASLTAPAAGADRDLSGCGGGRISWLRGANPRQVSSASWDQGLAEGPVGSRKTM